MLREQALLLLNTGMNPGDYSTVVSPGSETGTFLEGRIKKTIFLHTSGEGKRQETIIQWEERGEGRAQKPQIHVFIGGGVLSSIILLP